MLLWFVIAYWVVSVLIGLWAALKVHNTADFAVAGRGLPFSVVTATVFATWFGAECVLGVPARFLEDGLGGVVEDPFGSSMCLILVGLLFARPLYRMNLLTIGDFYRNRYGRVAEVLTTICIVVSYLGWVAAQIKALGVVFHVVSNEAISIEAGMWIGAASVLVYTLFGGMWSVAITDFIQMIVIILGMLYIAGHVSVEAGGVGVVVSHAASAGKFNFLPAAKVTEILGFIAALITMMLGSIPQQDVFQRVTSSKTEWIAGTASVLGGVLYFVFAFIPMYLGYSALLIDPVMVEQYRNSEEAGATQLILPTLIMKHAPLFAQILFFGALLSAIKSCASATLLAPSVTFAENILRPMLPKYTDKTYLRIMQGVVLLFTTAVTLFALYTDASIYEMVGQAYKVTLVSAFIPLACGLFWKQATKQGGLASMVFGLAVWIGFEALVAEDVFPPQLAGVLASGFGMVAGSLGPQWIANEQDTEPAPEVEINPDSEQS